MNRGRDHYRKATTAPHLQTRTQSSITVPPVPQLPRPRPKSAPLATTATTATTAEPPNSYQSYRSYRSYCPLSTPPTRKNHPSPNAQQPQQPPRHSAKRHQRAIYSQQGSTPQTATTSPATTATTPIASSLSPIAHPCPTLSPSARRLPHWALDVLISPPPKSFSHPGRFALPDTASALIS